MEIYKVLHEKRKEAGMTQEELANLCHVTRQTVSKWESGETLPDLGSLKILAETFQLSIDKLLDLNIEADDEDQFEWIILGGMTIGMTVGFVLDMPMLGYMVYMIVLGGQYIYNGIKKKK